MKLYTNIYWKNRPNNRVIKKRKIRQFAQKILKEGHVESQLALSSNPDCGVKIRPVLKTVHDIYFLK